jgi:hypothetical protein
MQNICFKFHYLKSAIGFFVFAIAGSSFTKAPFGEKR